jgi:predicted amidohydrolase
MTKESKEWPGHFFNTSFIIGPKGDVIHKHWKAHGDPGGNEYATTVHDVLDEFVKRYGWDAVWPVARTDIGNIATFICAEGFVPETARVYGLKGAEIICRCIAGGNRHYSFAAGGMDPGITMQAYCMGSSMYGIFCDSALITNPEPYSPEDIGCGNSRIWDHRGRQIAEARSNSEQIISTSIPIASFRQKHSIPVLRQEIYAPVYQQFVGKYPPNMYADYLPKDATDAINHARRMARY